MEAVIAIVMPVPQNSSIFDGETGGPLSPSVVHTETKTLAANEVR